MFLGWINDDVNRYIRRGVQIGSGTKIYSCDIDYGHGYLIKIGNNCTITHATILSHDASTKHYIGYSKVGKVVIGDEVFIGYGSVILPGVTIGNRVIVGANTVVRKSIPDNCVVSGNPMTILCSTDDFINKHETCMKSLPVFNNSWRDKTPKEKDYERNVLKDSIGYDI